MTSRKKRAKRKAAKAGLIYVNSLDDGIRRRPCGKGFTYLSGLGNVLHGKRVRSRIEQLAIPPAWREVRIRTFAPGGRALSRSNILAG